MVSILIICGGFGVRLKNLYPEVPKPLICINGRPFIEWIVLAFIARGFRHFVLATGHLSEKIESWSDGLDYKDCTFQVVKETQQLGTGGAILNALDCCNDEIIVTNGDSLLLFDFVQMMRYLDKYDMVIAARYSSDCSRYGRLQISKNYLLEQFIEKQPGEGLINGGVYCFRKSSLSQFEEGSMISMETEIIPALLDSHAKIFVYDVGDAPFIDIGTPETLKDAGNFLLQNVCYWKAK